MPLPKNSRYSAKPGVKPPKEKKQKGYVAGGPNLNESDVELIIEGVYEVFKRLAENGETDRYVFVTSLTDGDSISGTTHLVFVFPPDFVGREDEKCIQLIDEPLDYNFNAYEDVKPMMVNLTAAKSGMRYYWGDIQIDSGETSDTYEGKQCRGRAERRYAGGCGVAFSWDREVGDNTKKVSYTGDKRWRTPGVASIDQKDIRTNAYDPMDRM